MQQPILKLQKPEFSKNSNPPSWLCRKKQKQRLVKLVLLLTRSASYLVKKS